MDYIKLNRKIVEWEWYSDINTCRLFIHMLLKANWKEGRFQGTTVPRGSFISSIGKLSEETCLTIREVRTAISHLKMTGEVTSKTTNKYTVFTVNNYDSYQSNDKQDDNQLTSERQSNDKPTTTIEEYKEGKKGRSKDINKGAGKKVQEVYFDDEKLNNAFSDYAAMREEINRPLTDRAVNLAIKKLHKMSAIPTGGWDKDKAIQILQQSVINGWIGLFPLNEQEIRSNKGFGGFQQNTYDFDALEREAEAELLGQGGGQIADN